MDRYEDGFQHSKGYSGSNVAEDTAISFFSLVGDDFSKSLVKLIALRGCCSCCCRRRRLAAM